MDSAESGGVPEPDCAQNDGLVVPPPGGFFVRTIANACLGILAFIGLRELLRADRLTGGLFAVSSGLGDVFHSGHSALRHFRPHLQSHPTNRFAPSARPGLSLCPELLPRALKEIKVEWHP